MNTNLLHCFPGSMPARPGCPLRRPRALRVTVASLLAIGALVARGDPPEDVSAWPDPPVGFDWDQLGPHTKTVDTSHYAEVRHVSVATGSDDRGDGSAARPWQSLHRALARIPATGRVAVFVAAGTYAEETLTLPERVDWFGGFEPRQWQRDVSRNPTVLSGQKKQRVLVGADDCRLDGFVIEDGLIRGPGGGLLCDHVSPAIADREGGGIGGTHSWMHARNNTVVYNEAARDGGGIQIVNVKNPFLRASIFRNNIILDNKSDQLHLEGAVDVAYNIVHPGGYQDGYYNFDADTGFRDDGRRLSIRSVRPDPARFTTTLSVAETLGAGELTGRIIRLGEFWSMVRANTADEVTVWGTTVPPEAASAQVLPTFHLTAESRAVHAGAYPDFPPTDIDGEPRYMPNIDAGADQFHPTFAP